MLGALCLLFLSCKTEGSQAIAQNIKATGDFVTVDFEGFEDYIEAHEAETLVINFWATWCRPCIKELPAFERLGSEYDDKDVAVILVSLDFPDQLEKLGQFIVKKNIASEVLFLNDSNANDWIPKVDQSWSGAIPATLIRTTKSGQFYERSFTYGELEDELKKQLKI